MSSKVDCSLTIYEAKANGVSPNPDATAGGIIEIRIRLRYQLCIKAHGAEVLIDDILTPEFITTFAMPLAFLLPKFSVMNVSNMLQSINVDAKVRDFLSPNIANFAVDLAKRHGAAVSGFMTVGGFRFYDGGSGFY
ncbi:hypothetical protein CRYUN_Cryun14cG0138000 [Craigia yunnanensis]